MGKGKTENVARKEDYAFVDPTGQFQGQMDQLGRISDSAYGSMIDSLDPTSAFNAFLAQSGGLHNLVQGASSPFQQSLNALASRQADAGMQAAATKFNNMGAGRSGAANRALGEAAFTPFARANAQIAQGQMGMLGNLYGANLGRLANLQTTGAGLYGNRANTALGLQTRMAQEMGGMMAPQYEYQKGGWDYAMDAGNMLANLGTAAIGANVAFGKRRSGG
jgi:hypothetical protein